MYAQQENLDKYKYIIVPEKFEFAKEKDQYQTSSITKFLLEKKGFKVFISEEEYPKELVKNRCLAAVANVVDKSSMFTIKTQIEFRDCFNKVVYTSQVGKSKIKDYKRGFQEAIRNAYNSMEELEYKYNGNLVEVVEEKKEDEVIVKKDAVKVETTPVLPVVKEVVETSKKQEMNLPILYAQPKGNGYQLVNTTPEIVFLVLKTSKENSFILKNKNGTLYKNGDFWVAEYYKNDELVKEKYQIKF